MAFELAGRRLQNMRGWQAAGRDAPTAVLQKQGGFRLGAGKAELAPVTRQPPRGVIRSQRLQPPGDIGLVKPFDLVFLAAAYGAQTLRRYELNGARAVFAHIGNEGKGAARGHVKPLGPTIEHELVVRQEAP